MLRKIISGGQTGVDRAALDAALELSFPCGGWCPQGRRAEDGPIPARYPLQETPWWGYPQRTEWNVRDADATLILIADELAGGALLTRELAERMSKPQRVLKLPVADVRALWTWLEANEVKTLNVAGPRASEASMIYEQAKRLVQALIESARR
ncbi:MAG: putative molybdenum carrier protein [Gemmataceae bacterium]